jgi:aspartate/glutamate racemase
LNDSKKMGQEVLYDVGAKYTPTVAQAWRQRCPTWVKSSAGAGDTDLPVFDTTRIHAEAAMEFALAETPAADIM